MNAPKLAPKTVVGFTLAAAVVAAVGAGVWWLTQKKPWAGQPLPTTNTDPNKAPITVGIATGYNPVKYASTEVDLTHLNQVDGYRYAGGLI